VVDLADPEADLRRLHPRFAERVFTTAERHALEASRPDAAVCDAAAPRTTLHWALWAAKESAYKALKRIAPQAVFSPREFEVELPSVPLVEGGVAVGAVVHRGRRFRLQIQQHGASVHAIATSGAAVGAEILCRVARCQGDPSAAVRRIAIRAIGSALGLDPAALQIVGRPPVAMCGDDLLGVDLSLSHHGQLVAFACALPHPGAPASRGMLSPCVSSTDLPVRPSSAPPLSLR